MRESGRMISRRAGGMRSWPMGVGMRVSIIRGRRMGRALLFMLMAMFWRGSGRMASLMVSGF